MYDYLDIPILNSTFPAGSTHGDTAQEDASPPANVKSESLYPDWGYYNDAPYPSYPSYDYDAVYAATTQEDRQDIGLFGGVGTGFMLTALAAAFLGSLLAPAISGGVMNMEFRLP